MGYYRCSVAQCKNTTIKTPQKLFINVPHEMKRRKTWLQLAGRDPQSLSPKSTIHFCEDHFDLENDMENYLYYKLMGFVKQIRMKPNCLPSKFDYILNRKKSVIKIEKRKTIIKDAKSVLEVQEATGITSEQQNGNSDMDMQRYLQATSPPVITSRAEVAAGGVSQSDLLHIKEETEDVDLDSGPTVFQHMDSFYKTNQVQSNSSKTIRSEMEIKVENVIKKENTIDDEDKETICKVEDDQVLCSQVKEEIVQKSQKVVTDSQLSNFGCDKYLKKHQSGDLLMEHCNTVHGTDSLKFSKSNKILKSEHALAKHVNKSLHHKHSAELQCKFRCDNCSMTYTYIGSLLKHIQTHAKGLRKCTQSNKEFKDSYKCSQCKMDFKRKASLANHIRTQHSARQIECDICNTMCKSKQALQFHVYQNHTHWSAVTRLHSVIFICGFCQKTYTGKPALLQHIKCVHKKVTHPCLECNMIFKYEMSLQEHETLVHGKAQQECELCQRVFMTEHKLMEHIKGVHGSKYHFKTDSCPLEVNRSRQSICEKSVTAVTSA